MPLEFRKATINDIAHLAEMNKELIEDEKRRNPMDVKQLSLRMQGWIDGDWSAVMINKDHDRIGYLLYRQQDDDYFTDQKIIFIRQFFVQRAYRRRGIGRQAFEEIVNSYFPTDARLMLDVLATNPEALRFWEDLGFSVHATTLQRQASVPAKI